MISIRQKDYNNPPARLVDQTSIGQIRRACEARDGKVYSGNVYRDDSVRLLLKAYSIGKQDFDPAHDKPKCYYCESQGEEKGAFSVEHYRPKDGLSKTDLRANEEHHGYYWLGNEWSNLLLACGGCNGNNAKGTRFPITGKRESHHQPVDEANHLNRRDCMISSGFLLSENPVLLNPEYDVPENHLTFDETGQIFERNNSDRGKGTIKVLDLKRGALLIARREIVDHFQNEIDELIVFREENKIDDDLLKDLFTNICRKIHQRKNTDIAYTLWGRYINENFESIFISNLPEPYKQILRDAYVSAAI